MNGSFRARGRFGLAGVGLGSFGALGLVASSLGLALAGAAGCGADVPREDRTALNVQPAPVQPVQTQPPPVQPAPAQPTATQPAPPATQPAPVKPAPTQPPAPVQPTATQPAPVKPAPTQPPAPKPAPVQIQSIGVTPPTCVLKGTFPVAKDTQLFDDPKAGRAIAIFTGNHVPMALSEIPADALNDRSKLATSTGTGAVRLEGYVPTSAVPVFTTRDIAVMAGNVWISSAQRVKLTAATASSVTVERAVSGTRNQKTKATTTCDALTLQPGTPTTMEVPGNARGYLTKEPQIDIFTQPNGDAVFTLLMIEGGSQLFWSTESRAGFVHAKTRADLTIDGWIRLKDLDPLKKGEMMDQYIPPRTEVAGAQLALETPPRIATATRDIVIRARRDENDRPIGVVEAGAEIYVMETTAGWSSVLPKSLHVLPPEGGGFWILSSDTPK